MNACIFAFRNMYRALKSCSQHHIHSTCIKKRPIEMDSARNASEQIEPKDMAKRYHSNENNSMMVGDECRVHIKVKLYGRRCGCKLRLAMRAGVAAVSRWQRERVRPHSFSNFRFYSMLKLWVAAVFIPFGAIVMVQKETCSHAPALVTFQSSTLSATDEESCVCFAQ